MCLLTEHGGRLSRGSPADPGEAGQSGDELESENSLHGVKFLKDTWGPPQQLSGGASEAPGATVLHSLHMFWRHLVLWAGAQGATCPLLTTLGVLQVHRPGWGMLLALGYWLAGGW